MILLQSYITTHVWFILGSDAGRSNMIRAISTPPQVWLHEFLRRAECRADDPQEAREFCERLRRVMLLFEILRPPPQKIIFDEIVVTNN